MNTDEAYEAFAELAPAEFVNKACARVTIRGDKCRLVTQAKDVRCPMLFQVCDFDDLTPMSAVEEAADKVGQLTQVVHYPIGHFDIYFGENFERSVADQIDFFATHLVTGD